MFLLGTNKHYVMIDMLPDLALKCSVCACVSAWMKGLGYRYITGHV